MDDASAERASRGGAYCASRADGEARETREGSDGGGKDAGGGGGGGGGGGSGAGGGAGASADCGPHMCYYTRPRAASEAVGSGADANRGRLVAAWAAWKRSWDAKRRAEVEDAAGSLPHSHAVTRGRGRERLSLSADAKIPAVASDDSDGCAQQRPAAALSADFVDSLPEAGPTARPRKVVSLRLRRKSSSRKRGDVLDRRDDEGLSRHIGDVKSAADRDRRLMQEFGDVSVSNDTCSSDSKREDSEKSYGCFPHHRRRSSHLSTGSPNKSSSAPSGGSSPRLASSGRPSTSPCPSELEHSPSHRRSNSRRSSRNSPSRRAFGRVRSQLYPPVSKNSGGEGGRYLEYAAELDDDSFERLVEFAKQIAYERALEQNGEAPSQDVKADTEYEEKEDEDADSKIIGEIRLEDFADASGEEDFAFLDDAENEQLTDVEMSQRTSTRSLRMDSQKLTWIGNESEFAAFFAEVGLDDILVESDAPKVNHTEFDVDEETIAEWESAAHDHNEMCGDWVNVFDHPLDIRTLTSAYAQRQPSDGR